MSKTICREKAVGCAFAVVWLSCAVSFAAEHQHVGLTQKGTRIEASIVPGASGSASTVLLIGGVAGNDETSRAVSREMQTFEAIPPGRRPFRLIVIPVANPDATRLQFPPTGVAYKENSESHALWRWIGIHAPDLVLIAGTEDYGLAEAMAHNAPARVATIPARHVDAAKPILAGLPKDILPSDARKEIERRRSRTARQLADELAQVYGHNLDQVTYIQALALIARARMGETADVVRLAEPYVNGSKDSLQRPNSLVMAGHLVFGELAERTGDKRYVQLVKKAADFAFDEKGEMKDAMPFHGEMSDSVFMDFSILAKAGKISGEKKYFDMAARHFDFMQKLVQRPDGLFRHSPLTDAAWGRGNAFPALGMSLALSDFPRDHSAFNRLLQTYRQYMSTLAKFQDEDGLWAEVVDHPGAYPEFTATGMIAFAMLRGIHNGWLDAPTYQPIVDKAWQAVLTRVGPDGVFMDVSESTNKQPTEEDYLRRAAILDRDQRAGAMALMFATEMMQGR
jgi:rhamnogalacturonyl hydrolase YesR